MQDEVTQAIAAAISRLGDGVQWREGQDVKHLERRKRKGHLSQDASLADYTRLIQAVLENPVNEVYCYEFRSTGAYYGVVIGQHEAEDWLVMFTLEGVMETCFLVDDAPEYIAKRGFRLLGTVEELAQ